MEDYKRHPVRVGLYDIGETIGKGNFAVVKIARHRMTKSRVAVKIIDKSRLDEGNLKKVYREVQIMKLLKHPHVLKLYQVMETDNMLYIVTEYATKGEMFAHIDKNGKLSEHEARRIFWQIISAVEYCHNRHIVHRDLKTENLLLDDSCNVKIADFGFSNYTQDNELLKTWCGSPPYAAPEIFEGKEYDGPAIDIWSLGVVLYVLVCAALPFDGDTVHAVRDRVLEGRFRVPYFMSSELEDLLRKILVKNPACRYSLNQIKEHPWLREFHEDRSSIYNDYMNIENTFNGREVNEHVMQVIDNLGIDVQKTKKSLANNAYDHNTAIYYLLCERLRPHRTSFPEQKVVSTRMRRASCMAEQVIVQNNTVQSLVGHRQHRLPVSSNTTKHNAASLQYALNELHLGDVKIPPDLAKPKIPDCVKEFSPPPGLQISPRLTHYHAPSPITTIETVNEEMNSDALPPNISKQQRRGRRSAVDALYQNIRRHTLQGPTQESETLYVPANHPLLRQNIEVPPEYENETINNLKIQIVNPVISPPEQTSMSMIIKPDSTLHLYLHKPFNDGRRASDGLNAPFKHLLHKSENQHLKEYEELQILQRSVTPENISDGHYQKSHTKFREYGPSNAYKSDWKPSPTSSQNELMLTLQKPYFQDSIDIETETSLCFAPGPLRRPLTYRKVSGGVSPIPAHIRRRRAPVVGESPFNSIDMDD